jgi:hypothetical protein
VRGNAAARERNQRPVLASLSGRCGHQHRAWSEK